MWHGDYSCHLCCNRRSRKMTDYDARSIVFGYPFLQGRANTGAFHITNTIHGLSASGMLDDVTFTHWDETYTSKIEKVCG
ncbi:pre-16S rRNA nuclease [Artemisia annua]|uniref:Pre-16S rRNA nuclease n=1 Tax=Artemisia annua TaxID=35608 RepID=A0A2U1PRJ0_ARTAN|nr:pre-16S rRNA nuclease [Artemisia annua]